MPGIVTEEHVEAARAAGLRYVTNDMPGIRRKRFGRGFSYIGPDGKVIKDPDQKKRFKSLVIPPAWTDVWICPDPNGHIQVTARDAKGRKQYRYHPRYRRARDETKFHRMLAFSKVLPSIREKVEKDLDRPGLPRRKVLAAVVRLLEKTLIRIGNDEYAKDNQSFGLTTLRSEHVEVKGWKLRFEFSGKSGRGHSISLTDGRIAGIIQKCQTLPGEELFKYLDKSGKKQVVDSGDINQYMKEITGGDFSAKDFRTWAGTVHAAVALRAMGIAASQREARSNIVKAVDAVAEQLGNTRAVCRKYYIHPTVIKSYMNGKVLRTPPAPKKYKRRRPSVGLRRVETGVIEFLEL